MSIKKFVVGCFDDEAVLFPAVKKVRKAGYKIHDVYTPMPIHGLDTAMGLRETSLHTAGFFYALTGTITALSCMTWVFTIDWPLNIGGKPHFALPAWILAYRYRGNPYRAIVHGQRSEVVFGRAPIDWRKVGWLVAAAAVIAAIIALILAAR